MRPKAEGTKHFYNRDGSPSETWINWALLDARRAPESDIELICALGMEVFYNGPGQVFGKEPDVWRTKNRVLVTQRCGYDC